MINENFFDNFKIDNIEYDKNKVLIILKSTTLSTKYTYYYSKSSKVYSKYVRQVLDLPMVDKYTKLGILTRRLFCTNIDVKKIFSKAFNSFISRYKRLTEGLFRYLINIILTQSSNQAYRVINKLILIGASLSGFRYSKEE